MNELRLRPVRIEDETAALAGHESMRNDDFTFLLGHEESRSWEHYIKVLDDYRCGVNLVGRLVPSTFLFAVVNNEIVGRVSIRHELNEYLASIGGHIGYGVLPKFRRRGYATEILRQGLVIARSLGVSRVLVTCDDDNVASAKTIERCGGVYESTINVKSEVSKRRYWFD